MDQLGVTLIHDGRAEEGIDICMKAMEANPRAPMNHRIMWHIALGHFVLERYESAIEWAKRSDRQMPDVAPTLLVLTTAAAHAGLTTEAKRAAARLRALYPDFDMAALRRWPFRDAPTWDRFTGGLRKAGLDGSSAAAGA